MNYDDIFKEFWEIWNSSELQPEGECVIVDKAMTYYVEQWANRFDKDVPTLDGEAYQFMHLFGQVMLSMGRAAQVVDDREAQHLATELADSLSSEDNKKDPEDGV